MGPLELTGRLGLAIALTLVVVHGMTRLVRRAQQPPVVGEMIAGLALGRTLLGALPGDPSRVLFPAQVTHVLSVLGEIGVSLYLVLVGIDLGVDWLRSGKRSLVMISLSALLVPFAAGALLAIWLHGAHSVAAGHRVGTLPFMLFVGTAFGMTAFPVLTRILTDTGLYCDPLGSLAIKCAAILDGLGWMLLALALAVASSSTFAGLVRMVLEAAAFVGSLLLVVRPALERLVARQPVCTRPRPAALALLVAMMLAAAAATDAIGLHPLLGAVLFGAIFPRQRNPAFTAAVRATLEPVACRLLLPFFFLLPGLHIDLRQLDVVGIPELALILLVACAGKFLGAAGATRISGYRWREAAVIGTLMNTRGLIELVALSLGLSAHILDSKLYGLMVMMALVTTAMTTPVLRALRPTAVALTSPELALGSTQYVS